MPVRLRSLDETVKRFSADDHATTAVIFGLALIPAIGMAGAAVDYSRTASTHTALQRAVDGAALAAARAKGVTIDKRRQLATQIVEGQMAGTALSGKPTIVVTEPQPGQVKVDATGSVPTAFMHIFKQDKVDIAVTAVAAIPSDVEVALVLDTTGSMKNDMSDLRAAATKFVETIFSASPGGDALRVSVVPYVAAVNPGRTFLLNAGAVDTDGMNKWHANNMRNRYIASIGNCVNNPSPPPPPPGPPPPPSPPPPPPPPPGPPPPPPPPPPPRERESSLQDGWNLPSLKAIALELFGVSAAQAGATPNTNTPLFYWPYTVTPPYSTTGLPFTVNIPLGFQAGPLVRGTACNVYNPSHVNHLDLFERIPGTRWKGCVEARPDGLDLKEDPPTSSNARFVPYFWPDEPGTRDDKTMSNSYLDAVPQMPGFNGGDQDWLSILRYNAYASNAPRIVEDQATTYGPNASCPDEVLPLTMNKDDVLNRIGTLKHYFGGGTISSEGMMWGWRTLSPNRPYAMGKEYGKVRKFIVLMSDGENMISANNNSSGSKGPTSDYSAYGYLWQGRLGTTDFNQAATTLDNKLTQACKGAKDKDITVVTILFRESSQRAVDNVRNCATSSDLFYRASDKASLETAFQNIAAKINNLRLVR